ncbi:MAG: DNA (cytosine-5-)-methyltransferase [Acholeplasmataceae bacterium]
MNKTVVELFAGVGGFRVGFNNVKLVKDKTIEKDNFNFVWTNQWEPSTKIQHAFDCYKHRFSGDEKLSNVDIAQIDKKSIPNHTVLCGGFPCQDYSVARTLSGEKGIQGKKGVLWWQINQILEAKRPPFVFLENVDRLIKSPSKQRGRDFSIMLRCLNDLGYAVEWRVINAADYGHYQRRRRVYILAYNKITKYYQQIMNYSPEQVIYREGIFANTFPIIKSNNGIKSISILKGFNDLVSLSDDFQENFNNSGFLIDGVIHHVKVEPVEHAKSSLSKIILKKGVEDKYFLSKNQEEKFKFLRGSKKIERTSPDGKKYYYSEGSMAEIDDLGLPGRTMLTSEGSINRSTHIIKDPASSKLRILTPIECERLNEFPDNWTNTGMPEKRRYFMMGNALVTGVISKVATYLSTIIDQE